jgi:hypothetical protein
MAMINRKGENVMSTNNPIMISSSRFKPSCIFNEKSSALIGPHIHGNFLGVKINMSLLLITNKTRQSVE